MNKEDMDIMEKKWVYMMIGRMLSYNYDQDDWRVLRLPQENTVIEENSKK
jgi:hypothetical protein